MRSVSSQVVRPHLLSRNQSIAAVRTSCEHLQSARAASAHNARHGPALFASRRAQTARFASSNMPVKLVDSSTIQLGDSETLDVPFLTFRAWIGVCRQSGCQVEGQLKLCRRPFPLVLFQQCVLSLTC